MRVRCLKPSVLAAGSLGPGQGVATSFVCICESRVAAVSDRRKMRKEMCAALEEEKQYKLQQKHWAVDFYLGEKAQKKCKW